jgi:hypothetical protein
LINVIGDSHAERFSLCDEVRRFGLGTHSTAFNLWKHREIIEDIISNYPDEKWYFMFGEVDCRIHIYLKQKQLNLPTYESLIDNTVDSYLGFLSSLQCPIGVFAVPPQGFEENIYEHEFYADRQTRQNITDSLNTQLLIKCYNQDIEFVDLFLKFRIGLLDREYFEDDTHMKRELISGSIVEWYNPTLSR